MSTESLGKSGVRSSSPVLGNVLLWTLQVAAAAMFLMAGGSKLAGAAPMVEVFEHLGVGQWFRYVTGGLEVVGAILLLVPALAGVGGLLLAGIMVGAVASHVFKLGGSPAPAAVLLVVSLVIAFFRRDRTLRLLGK